MKYISAMSQGQERPPVEVRRTPAGRQRPRAAALADTVAPPPRSLSERAFAALEELIVTLELPPGSLWSETGLSERIGIGRTPVREAVQRLAEYHLVLILKRHGIRIAEVSEQQQLLALETRRELERLIAVRATRRATGEDKQAMAVLAQQMRDSGARGAVHEFLRHYFVAKSFLARCARNPFAAQALAPLHTLSRRFYFMHYAELNDLPQVAKLHADVLLAVAKGDEIEAAAASDRQLDYAEDFAKRIITRDF